MKKYQVSFNYVQDGSYFFFQGPPIVAKSLEDCLDIGANMIRSMYSRVSHVSVNDVTCVTEVVS
jgi:hypothetical protein